MAGLNEWDFDEVIEYFHYTDLNGLIGILNSKTLRLCSYRGMNDNLELYWFQNKLRAQIEKSIRSHNLETQYLPILDHLYSLLSEHTITLYLSSFSKERDRLSQWRAYANDGKGVSIGISFNNFPFKKRTACPSKEVETSTGYVDVIYDPKEQHIKVMEFEDLFFSYALKIIRKELKIDHLQILATSILVDSAMYKNPAFEEEQEVRIIQAPMYKEKIGHDGTLSKIQFKNTEDQLTSYFTIPIRESMIESITLGPKCRCDEREIKLFLQHNGYDYNGYDHNEIKIIRSTASYC